MSVQRTYPVQPFCDCCRMHIFRDCAAVPESERTGRCTMLGPDGKPCCTCYGTNVDDGLCEDCYVSTK